MTVRRSAIALVVFALTALAPAPSSAATDSRLLFVSDRTGLPQIYSITSSGGGLGQLTFDCPGDYCPASRVRPSPNGRWIVFGARDRYSPGNTIWIAEANGRGRRVLARGQDPSWAPDSLRIAYASSDGIHVVLRDGSAVERFTTQAGDCQPDWSPDGQSVLFISAPSAPEFCPGHGGTLVLRRNGATRVLAEEVGGAEWSPDGRWIAYWHGSELHVIRPDGSGETSLGANLGFTWAPDGRRLALATADSIRIVTLGTWTTRTLVRDVDPRSPAWSPRGEGVAYVARRRTREGGIRLVTLGGRVRTILRSYPYGGDLGGLAWTTPTARVTYQAPARVRLPQRVVSKAELAVWAPVARLAADRERVAYSFGDAHARNDSCNVSVWNPAAGVVTPMDLQVSAPPGECREPLGGGIGTVFRDYSLALGGAQIAYAFTWGGTTYGQNIVRGALAEPFPILLAGASTTKGEQPVVGANIGRLLADGPLVVFSTWNVACRPGSLCTRAERFVDEQAVWRLREPSWPGGCPTWGRQLRRTSPGPCQEVASARGPLVPLAVDGGLIAVAREDQSIRLLDANGRELRSVPLAPGIPLAAELAGRDLAVLTRGRLHHYDASTGELLHSWPLPDVPSGGDCGCVGYSLDEPVRLRLEDAAHGLALYLLDDEIHLLRLRDGRDVVAARGTAAQLEDSGLFYAFRVTGSYPGRIRFVPFERLPLR